MNIAALEIRARVLRQLRAFFDARGFIEVETPVRIAAPAPEPHIDCPAAIARPDAAALVRATFLRASPELQMKKLLAAGMARIYQIGPCFREGERGRRHNPEFTMLEWYRSSADYLDILADMEALFAEIFALNALKGFNGFKGLNGVNGFKGVKGVKCLRLTVREAYLRWAGWDPFAEWDAERFDLDMATKIEPNLPGGPLFLMDYPPQAASLAKLRGNVAERWELYVNGLELANAFTELTDPAEQRRRFEEARAERRRLGEADYPLDEAFLDALARMPPAGGVALGVDRLAMLVCGVDDISTVRTGE